MKLRNTAGAAALVLAATAAAPVIAQDATTVGPADQIPSNTVYDGDWISIGAGVALSPSYDGSDDYVFSPVPLIQGQIGRVGISPRPAGLALDFIPAPANGGVDIHLGVVATLNRNRASRIEDEVVKRAGELDTAIEVGPTAGVSFPGLLNPYDSLSLIVDARWDILGAHNGMLIEPGVTYFTPLSRGIAASLSASAEYGDDDYNDYYYSVNGPQALATGLPLFGADAGFNSVGTTALLGVDLDGNLANGGIAAVLIGGYSRMLGDAKDTPYTRLRGSANQFFGAIGVGYTF